MTEMADEFDDADRAAGIERPGTGERVEPPGADDPARIEDEISEGGPVWEQREDRAERDGAVEQVWHKEEEERTGGED